MAYAGPAFYDDDAIFKTYTARRERKDNPNDTLEKPVLLEMIGDVANRNILDLGCGDAAFGKELLAMGCHSYCGVEGSKNMFDAAQRMLAGTKGQVIQATLQSWDYPSEAFDLVLSRLVLHYIQDVEALFRQVYQALTPAGRFIFSVEHPVITSSDQVWQGAGPRQNWVVDNYFDTGERITSWMNGQVIKYHRTIENYFMGLQGAGFRVESLREAEPQRQHFASDDATYQRRRRIPLFLMLSGQKCQTIERA